MTHITTLGDAQVKAFIQSSSLNNHVSHEAEFTEKTEVLLLIEPVLVNGEYYSLADFWREWLLQNNSQVKIATCTWFSNKDMDRYQLDLLHLPTDIPEFFTNLPSITEHSKFPIYGKDIRSKLKILLDGHGEESLLKLVTQLKSSLDIALFLIEDGNDLEEVSQSTWTNGGDIIFKELNERMHSLNTFFKHLPISRDFAKHFRKITDFKFSSLEEIQLFTNDLTAFSLELRTLQKLGC